jgi:hypothetical protein
MKDILPTAIWLRDILTRDILPRDILPRDILPRDFLPGTIKSFITLELGVNHIKLNFFNANAAPK